VLVKQIPMEKKVQINCRTSSLLYFITSVLIRHYDTFFFEIYLANGRNISSELAPTPPQEYNRGLQQTLFTTMIKQELTELLACLKG
jgi:hypothetical protein